MSRTDLDYNTIPSEIISLFVKNPGNLQEKDEEVLAKILELIEQGKIGVDARVYGDKNLKECEGQENLTLLYLAARFGYYKTMAMLLDKGAKPEIPCKYSEGEYHFVYNSFIGRFKSDYFEKSLQLDYQKITHQLLRLPYEFERRFEPLKDQEKSSKGREWCLYFSPLNLGVPYNIDDEELKGSYLYIKKEIQKLNFSPDIFRFNDKTREIICYGPIQYMMRNPHLKDLFGGNIVVSRAGNRPMHDWRATLIRNAQPVVLESFKQEAMKFEAQKDRKKEVKQKTDLFSENLCIGERHSDLSSKRFLIENMVRFKEEGYEILFMEHLFYDSAMQDALDFYFASSESSSMPTDLEDYLKVLDDGFQIEDSDYNFLELVKAAKVAGIRIVGLDNETSYAMGHTEFGSHGIERAKGLNYAAKQIIEREGANRKWLALMGNTHIRTYEGIGGIADMFDAVAVNVRDVRGNALEYKYGEVATKVVKQDGKDHILQADVAIDAGRDQSLRIDDRAEILPKPQIFEDVSRLVAQNPLFSNAVLYRPSSENNPLQVNDRYDFALENNVQSQLKDALASQEKRDFNRELGKIVVVAIEKLKIAIDFKDVAKIFTVGISVGGFSSKTNEELQELAQKAGIDEKITPKIMKNLGYYFQQACDEIGLKTGNKNANNFVGMRMKRVNINDLPEIMAFASLQQNSRQNLKTCCEEFLSTISSSLAGINQAGENFEQEMQKLGIPKSSPLQASVQAFLQGTELVI